MADTPSGIQTEPPDDADWADAPKTPFPALMLAAGVMWLQAGAADLSLLAAARAFGLPLGWADLMLAIAALVLISNGVLLIRGTAAQLIRPGVVSALLGTYLLWKAAADLPAGRPGGYIAMAFHLLDAVFGVLFLLSGVFVLIARQAYRRWQAEKAMADLIHKLTADEEDEDR